MKTILVLISLFALYCSQRMEFENFKNLLKDSFLEVKHLTNQCLVMDTSSSIYFKTEDLVKFTKVAGTDGNWTTLRTVYPVQDNIVTTVQMQVLQTKYGSIRFGLLSKPDNIAGGIGILPNSWAYDFSSGSKYLSGGSAIQYGSPGSLMDEITIKIDLTETGTLEYLKNGDSMGIAFSGLKQAGSLYFAFSVAYSTDVVTFTGC